MKQINFTGIKEIDDNRNLFTDADWNDLIRVQGLVIGSNFEYYAKQQVKLRLLDIKIKKEESELKDIKEDENKKTKKKNEKNK